VAFILMAVLTCLQAIALIVEMKRSYVVPFVVAVDGLHQVVASGLATETTPVDPILIRQQIQNYVENARGISSDQSVLKDRLEKAFDSTVAPSPAHTMLVEYYRTESPFELAADGTVQVAVHNITAISSKSYEVNWTETKRDKEGNTTATEEWKGVLGVVVSPPKNEADAWKNPLGVYINAISWSKSI
jgi:type IV secretion system protein VirB5